MPHVYTIHFSPTGTSRKVAGQIAQAFGGVTAEVDLCRQQPQKMEFGQADDCIFSVPCYGGRIPQAAAKRLSGIRGAQTPAVVCVTFGNRAFEDALLELADCVQASGFQVAAACAVSAEHNIMHIFGQGRPDALDRQEIQRFAAAAAKKVADGKTGRPVLPGNRPYKDRHAAAAPILVDEAACTQCGQCALQCPVNAISADGWQADRAVCINCMRCIQICPQKSRRLPEEFVDGLVQRLRAACQDRKANAFYL